MGTDMTMQKVVEALRPFAEAVYGKDGDTTIHTHRIGSADYVRAREALAFLQSIPEGVGLPAEKLAEWQELSDDALSGPWYVSKRSDKGTLQFFRVEFDPALVVCRTYGDSFGEEKDAAFIAASREAVPALIAEVHRLLLALADRQRAVEEEREACAKLAESALPDRCPFRHEAPPHNIQPEDPCPVCGDLGTLGASFSGRCISDTSYRIATAIRARGQGNG